MIFDIPAVIAYCSQFTILEPGDVIVMGTPGGVGAKRVPPLWLKAGDVVGVSIEGIGQLSNPVTLEA
jgi:2-keto-4-pentenoate hydratase/2-oxohepta-3-ene-1,7-dioic acid hydratase in catechol pathway